MNRNVSVVIILVFWLAVFFFLKLSMQKESGKEDAKVDKKSSSQATDIKNRTSKPKAIVKKEKKKNVVQDSSEEAPDEEEVFDEEETRSDSIEVEEAVSPEKQAVLDFMKNRKAEKNNLSKEEKKNDFSTVSGKGTGKMISKQNRMQREKEKDNQ